MQPLGSVFLNYETLPFSGSDLQIAARLFRPRKISLGTIGLEFRFGHNALRTQTSSVKYDR